jgi:hypothetical protein
MKTAECNDNDYQGDGLRTHDIELTPTGYSRLVTKGRENMNWNRKPITRMKNINTKIV